MDTGRDPTSPTASSSRWLLPALLACLAAFATGVAEAMMTSGSTGWDAKLHEHVKYWYDTQAWLPKNVVLANAAAFRALDKPLQDAVLEAAAEAETRGLAASKQANGDSLDKLRGEGPSL